MGPEETIFEATKRLGFLVDGFDFSRKANRANAELEVLQAYFMKELEGVKNALWPIHEAEEFVAKSLNHIELAQKSLSYFNFHDAHFHANSAHGFLSRVGMQMSLEPEMVQVEKTALWNGLTYGFGIAFAVYLAVFALVSVLVFFV